MDSSYSDIVIDHFEHPRNRGELAGPDGVGRAGQGDHEYVTIFLRVRDETIADIRFQAAGCEPAVAAASITTELALGKHLDEASHISQDTIVSALGGLPPDRRHTAGLAAEALAAAIMDYVVRSVEGEVTKTTKATKSTKN